MSITLGHVILGISIILLVIYGLDVIVGSGVEDGFLPFNAMTRGIAFGFPPIILSIIAFFISKKPPYKVLGIMLIITGILILVGGIMSITAANQAQNFSRVMGEGGSITFIGVIIIILGIIKIRKSKSSVS
ncbi:MAG: hypothetical protein ACKVN8_00720 [Nitrosarchaeum sp.]